MGGGGCAQEFAFLTSSKVTGTPLAQGPPLENITGTHTRVTKPAALRALTAAQSS